MVPSLWAEQGLALGPWRAFTNHFCEQKCLTMQLGQIYACFGLSWMGCREERLCSPTLQEGHPPSIPNREMDYSPFRNPHFSRKAPLRNLRPTIPKGLVTNPQTEPPNLSAGPPPPRG